MLSEADLAAFGRGEDWRLWERLGAHPRVRHGVEGVQFAVWAPNAAQVSVVGDFNDWKAARVWLKRAMGRGETGAP